MHLRLESTPTYNNHNLRNFVLALIEPQRGGPTYRIYDISFSTDKTNHLLLGIQETEEHSPLDVFQEVKTILGEMPIRWLSQAHFIIIEKGYPFASHGEFKDISYQNTSNPENRHQKIQQMFPQLSPRIEGRQQDRTYFAIQISLHHSSYPKNTGNTSTYRESAINTVRHEIGHLVAYIYYGSVYVDQEWQNAVIRDGTPARNIKNIDISKYDDKLFSEDFAEGCSYLSKDI